MTVALIVGSAGQDGYYLTQQLRMQGYETVGLARDGCYRNGEWTGPPVDICAPTVVHDLIARVGPDEIYYLAALHHSSEENTGADAELFAHSFAVHVDALLALVEGMHRVTPSARLFYAASCLIFGEPAGAPQTEETPVAPICPYGITKAAGLEVCRYYRRRHGLFCAGGILYTHESPRRSPRFLSRRIVRQAVAISCGRAGELVVGDPDARVDWGFAPDYVDAMQRILRVDVPDDFIVATGQAHPVRDFIDAVFAALGLSPEGRLRIDPARIVRAQRGVPLIGNPAKLAAATGWRNTVDLEHLARLMVSAELAV